MLGGFPPLLFEVEGFTMQLSHYFWQSRNYATIYKLLALLPSSAKPQLVGLVLFLVNPVTKKNGMADDLNIVENGRRPQL